MVGTKRKPVATTPRLHETSIYQQSLGCLTELGNAEVSEEVLAQCTRILDDVLRLGVVLAHCDIHKRYPIAIKGS